MTDVTNTETATGFDALKGLSASVENDAPVYVQKLDAQGRAYAIQKKTCHISIAVAPAP